MRRNVVLALLFLLLGVVALGAAGCGGEDEVSPTAENAEEGAATETETTEDEGGDGAAEGDAAAGEAIYNEQGCGGCHTLEAAGSSGSIGPNLDESKPDFELAVDRVTNGSGAMPAFSDKLSPEEINNVAAYVVESTSG
jgi:mono/diheme cytochrome c family protein